MLLVVKKNKLMRKFILSIFTFFAASASSFSQQEFTHPDLLSWEDGRVLFIPSTKSALTISDLHYKHGSRSLAWTWAGDSSSIRLNRSIAWAPDPTDAPDPSTYTFVFWLYAVNAQSGATLRFEFLKDGKVCSWFDYGLDFVGWRGAWLAFERDMQGSPGPGMDALRITVHGARQGVLYFDLMIPSSLQDLRHHTADTQAPFINQQSTGIWLVNERCSRYKFDLPVAPIAEKDKLEVAKIEKRFAGFYLENKKPLQLDSLQKRLDAYGIQANADGTLRGKPVFFVRWGETYFSLGHPRSTRMFAQTVADLDDANRLLLQLAIACRLSEDRADRERAESMFVLLTRYMMDQGFVHGASLGTIHHLGYSMRDFYTACYLMKKELYAAGLGGDAQRAMEWFSNAAEVKRQPAEPGMSIDIFNTTLMGRLASILMLPDSPEKLTYLRCYTRWLNNGFAYSPGLEATFKIDGTVFHHANSYPAYARDGMRGAVEGVYILSGTGFAVSEEAHGVLKKALLTMRFYCNLRDWPISMAGRHPKGSEGLQPSQLGLLALAGSPDGAQQIDADLAAAYLRLVQSRPGGFTKIFEENHIKPEPAPQGNQALPYASVMTQRRGEWAATVRGHSRYLWAAESYEGANWYGRYLAHGNLQLVGNGNPIGNEASGYMQKGWDWNHWWGTTATVLPMARLKANIINADPFSGFEEMLYSDEAFAGPVSIEGKNGAYAMKLHEHDKYNGSLRARKSYFFFDNRIVCLGSDVESKVADYPTETTLFQEFIPQGGAAVTVNGEQVSGLPYEWRSSGSSWMADAQGNAYFVRKANVYLRRSHQHSFDQATAQPTENDFTVAAISHGNAPADGRYEYAIVVKPSQAELALWIKNLKAKQHSLYTIIRHDRQAHVVRDEASGTTGYALFEAGEVSKGLLLSNSIPCMAMLCEKSKGEIVLSLADPDLRLYEGPSDDIFDKEGKRVERSIYSRPWIGSESGVSHPRITLQGRWSLPQPSEYCKVISSDRKNTVLEFTCQHGLSREVRLIRSAGKR